eukprot:10375992-Alexandrium_andersonii.AAC.1
MHHPGFVYSEPSAACQCAPVRASACPCVSVCVSACQCVSVRVSACQWCVVHVSAQCVSVRVRRVSAQCVCVCLCARACARAFRAIDHRSSILYLPLLRAALL